MNFQIVRERPRDAALIESLLDRTFGFDRNRKTVCRLREGEAPMSALCFVAHAPDGELLGSLRFWAVRIGAARAVLLGPLSVAPALQGAGIGRALLRHGLSEARRLGERLCVVVGDPAYYGPFGFGAAAASGLILPGPVEAQRFQVLEIVPGALDGVSGLVGRAEQDARRRGLRRALYQRPLVLAA